MKLIKQLAACVACCVVLGAVSINAQDRPENLGRIFQRLDKNGDGFVDDRELQRQSVFDQYDADKDGRISRAEVGLEATDQTALRATKDVRYGAHEHQRLDHYRPAETRNAPVMVYVHGGGWRLGDKKAVGSKAEFFCDKGWVFVSVNYRLLPDGQHPHNVNDVAAAIAWVAEHAAELGIDRERLFVMGHSAGAHLASLVATHPQALTSAGLSRGQIRGVISLDTNAYDVARLMRSSSARYYSQVFGRDTTVLRDASPEYHIADDTDIPPFLICYSKGMGLRKDPQRATNARAFEQALRKHNIDAQVVDASDRNHSQINQRFGTAGDSKVTARAWQFLSELARPTNTRKNP
ncbi:MAG: alpha/beta hydrolase fold domain-containing protein [Planctomycetaceae bacterium]|nr:alpha/beta hydrolase fold domain-containing protein [Planctomycetaceae bacterium]